MMVATPERFYGTWYTQYRHHEGFARRAQLLQTMPEPLLIVGCAFGYLVEELRKLGKDVDGIDASRWAIENKVSDRVYLLDIFHKTAIEIARQNKGNVGPFATVVTEDLLPCLTDNEARTVAVNCARLGNLVVHLVTERGEVAELNYHPTGYWMNLTNQIAISLEGM